ncbi:hypothetical protein B484DRAFT_214121 [Ochromonadaceae sp. CCMP2298]|nr:hypothetical protein B484DRAFT_214121 [Ochromonadaceae sp. CCMP2298]
MAVGGAGRELWRTDGTVEGTLRVDDIFSGGTGSNPTYLASFGDYLYFAATSASEGRELWRTRGEQGGAEMIPLADTTRGIYPGPTGSHPTELTVADSYLFFAATDPYRGRELWYRRYDAGLVEDLFNPGVTSLIDLVPGAKSSNPQGFTSSGGSLPVLFQATNTAGAELWITDGTSAGTHMVRDLCPGSGSSSPAYITWFRGSFYFRATDCHLGAELWTSDGTAGGTHMVKDVRPGSADSGAAYLTVMASQLDGLDYLYFAASDGVYNRNPRSLEGLGGAQLWRSDGTEGGTVRAFDRTSNDLYFDRQSLDAAYPASFGVYKAGLYVSANYGTDRTFPKGGFEWGSNASAYLVDQAVVVGDADSHPRDNNVTVVLRVDRGLLLLGDQTEVGENSPARMQFLVAESRLTDRVQLTNALLALGHEVESVLDGRSAYERVTARYEEGKTNTLLRQYDCLLVALEFSGGSVGWDGLQAIRQIRDWETLTVGPEGAGGVGRGANSTSRIPIVAMSKLRNLIDDQAQATEAGADLLLLQTVTDYTAVADLTSRVEKSQGTSVGASLQVGV